MAQLFETFGKGVQFASLPGLEQAGQPHAGLGSLSITRTTTDLAYHHQPTDAALGQIVIGAQAVDEHELEQFVLVPQQPFGQRAARVGVGFGIHQSQRVRAAGQHHVLCHARLKPRLPRGRQPGLGIIVAGAHRLRPGLDFSLERVPVLEIVQRTQQMHPAALMLALKLRMTSLTIKRKRPRRV